MSCPTSTIIEPCPHTLQPAAPLFMEPLASYPPSEGLPSQALQMGHDIYGRAADLQALLECLRDLPLSRLLSFGVTQTLPIQDLSQISPSEIQKAIIDTVRDAIYLLRVQSSEISGSNQHEGGEEDIEESLFSAIFSKVRLLLTIRHPKKTVYKFITFSPKPQLREKVASKNCASRQGNSETTERLSDLLVQCQQTKPGLLQNRCTLTEILSSIECPNQTKELILGRFNELEMKVVNHEKEGARSEEVVSELREVIGAQMRAIMDFEEQNLSLNEEIAELLEVKAEYEERYLTMENRLNLLNEEVNRLEAQIQSIKGSPQPTPVYYTNPLWQKRELQDKYMLQIVQLQSDLLMEKTQQQQLSDAILELIKLSHSALEDMMVTPRFSTRFDQAVLGAVGELRCFQKMEWDGVLNLREETGSVTASEMGWQHLKKSGISMFSDIDFEQRSVKEEPSEEDTTLFSEGQSASQSNLSPEREVLINRLGKWVGNDLTMTR